jgi:hypothetical protein
MQGEGLVKVYNSARRFLGIGEFAVGGLIAPKRIFMLQAANI